MHSLSERQNLFTVLSFGGADSALVHTRVAATVAATIYRNFIYSTRKMLLVFK